MFFWNFSRCCFQTVSILWWWWWKLTISRRRALFNVRLTVMAVKSALLSRGLLLLLIFHHHSRLQRSSLRGCFCPSHHQQNSMMMCSALLELLMWLVWYRKRSSRSRVLWWRRFIDRFSIAFLSRSSCSNKDSLQVYRRLGKWWIFRCDDATIIIIFSPYERQTQITIRTHISYVETSLSWHCWRNNNPRRL